MELLAGCGNSLVKRITFAEIPEEWIELVTLDIDPTIRPDSMQHVVHDLNSLPYPFDDDMFDEVHAYEVLEHCGSQGDWMFFFDQFTEFHRILKPGGFFCATVPMWDSPWAWGDPGHRRVICAESLLFLKQSHYEAAVGNTSMQDYRGRYKVDFELYTKDEAEHQFGFVLRKPL